VRTHPGSTQRSLAESFALALITKAAILTLANCAGVDTAVVASPGVEFNLAVGKTATLSGSDYRITFNRVTDDSRCPVDVQCVWAGDARIELTVSRNSAPGDTRAISLTSPNNEVTVGDLRIRFVSLAPTPRQSEPPASRAYIARLLALTP
jgi:hypothetical protein